MKRGEVEEEEGEKELRYGFLDSCMEIGLGLWMDIITNSIFSKVSLGVALILLRYVGKLLCMNLCMGFV